MSRGLTVLSFGLGIWALMSVFRAIRLAEIVAAGGGRVPSLWGEAAVWLAPVLLGGVVAVISVSLPSRETDPFLARNVRLGVMVAIFAVLLSWALVLFAGYLGTLSPPGA